MDGMTPIDNYADTIDSRDILSRIEYLELDENAPLFDSADRAELEELRELVENINNSAEDNAADGVQLIRDSYFREYAEELAEDCGMVDSNATWPNSYIDWERAARDLQMDYSSVKFDGTTYWVR